MAAIRVGAKLNFINADKIGPNVQRHRFGRGNPILRARRDDLFLARDQRHHGRAAQGDYFVINLARKQAQRQANNPRAVPQHPLDGIMRFAGVGRAQHGRDPLRRRGEFRAHRAAFAGLQVLALGGGLNAGDSIRSPTGKGVNFQRGMIGLDRLIRRAQFFKYAAKARQSPKMARIER